MCGKTSDKPTQWTRDLPNSEGDWLWVCQWSCGCVRQSGIAWVRQFDSETDHESLVALPGGWSLSWEGQKPTCGISDVVAWMKVDLPPSEWAEELEMRS